MGLFRTEFLFMGRHGQPAGRGRASRPTAGGRRHGGLPITIRTVDIGADKPLDKAST